MSTPARIDELRKKFDENPRRYFAPLANEYRKAGDLDQAIALCREHLPKQPGHMSGHIVYGQALYEAGELIQARSVFESALQLDPENLIALRHLGDIAKASGDPSTARRWYERVLDADPRNDDIAAQLATLGGTPASSMPAVSDASKSGFAPAAPTPAFGFGALPTPDAAMRAVDFDVVNAQIARYTPLDLDAIDAGTDRTARNDDTVGASSEALIEGDAVEAVRPTYEPLDLDAMDALEPQAEFHAEPPPEREPEPASQPASQPEPVAADLEPAVTAHSEAESVDTLEPAVESAAVESTAPAPAPAPVVEETAHENEFDAAYAASDATQEEESFVARAADDAADYSSNAAEGDVEEDFEEGFFAPEWPADTADIIASIATPRSVTPLFNAPQASSAVTPPYGSATPDAVLAFGRERDEPAVEDAHVEDSEFDAPPAGAPSSSHSDLMADASNEDVVEAAADETREAVEVAREVEPVEAAADDTQVTEANDDTEAEPEWLASVAEFEASIEPTFEDVQSSAAGLSADVEIAGAAFIDETSFADVAPEPSAHEVPEDSPHEIDAESESEAEGANTAPAAESMPAFATETMGELLVSQGFVSRAVDVYEELVRRRPYDPVLTSRLAELRERVAAESQGHAPRNTPLYSTPLQNIAQRTTPLHSTPLQNIAERSTPLRNTPLRSTPLRNTPLRNTPLRNTPLRSTPLHSTPLHSNAVDAFGASDDAQSITSRELFARLAARRVPRRTPPQALSAIAPDRSEGLSSLFGSNDGGQDDSAARALADAFAPIAASDMVSGSTLDFDFGASGGSAGRSATAVSPATPVVNAPVLPDAGGAASSSTTPSANAGFSFDRFFPDPARAPKQGATPSEPTAATPQNQAPAKPAEDLAQFSQWLKGLGGS